MAFPKPVPTAYFFAELIARAKARLLHVLISSDAFPLGRGFDPIAVLSTTKGGRKRAGAASSPAEAGILRQKAERMFAVREKG